MLETDRELLDAFRRGERHALEQVYREFFDEVELIVRRGFVTGAQAEHRVPGMGADDQVRDVIQETFARAFAPKAREGYDGLRPYRPYLIRIAKNLMIDRARASNRKPVLADEEGVGDIDAAIDRNEALRADAPMAADEAIHWKRLTEAYGEYAETLDEEERELVRVRYEDGISQRDAAEELGISRRRVRTVENRVKLGLERFLQDRGLID